MRRYTLVLAFTLLSAHALAQQTQTGISRIVIGVSGGIDSTQALLVCTQAMDRLGYPRRNVLAYTMPGFATGARTLDQARRLMAAIGCDAHEIDIRPAATQMLKDLGLDPCWDNHGFADQVEGVTAVSVA